MGVYDRSQFDLGWQPSSDAFNAPKNALLRADNLMLDEVGALTLRQGSAKINSSAFSDTDVHSLFTTTLSSTRYRMSGATSAAYANGSSIATGFAGTATDDISFGAHMGQILMARSTTKKKYDGTTVRTWGIAAPNAAATLTALSADSKVFASCASTESPAMTSNEGTQAFAADKAGTANAAVELTPDATTGRATSTKTFASAQDYTTYDAAQTGTDDDLIEFYAYVTEPQYMDRITLMIDVNDALFQEDYYYYEFVNGQPFEVALTTNEFLASNYTAEGYDRDDVRSRLETRELESTFRNDEPVSNSGWVHFSVPRGKMNRVGSTAGKNWSTVWAVRITFVGLAGGSGAACRFDDIKIIGGAERPLTGRYKAMVVAAYNSGTYVALSAPSAVSAEIEVKAQGIRATVGAGVITALDSQVNELHLYLMGGRLNGFYRYTVKTGGPFSGAQTIDATSSDRTALIADIRLETDNTTPPDSIIGIEGPHFDRTLCLTSTHIYPSRRLNPDSFSSGEAVRVGDAAETALWIKKLNEALYVGTTRDVYRIDGDWTPLADGTINISKRPLGVGNPPISAAVAVGPVGSGDILVYLTAAGWKVLGGPLLTIDAVDLLWRGFTRHGVSSVAIATSTARFRCAISKNVLFALTPEGSDTTSTVRIHAYHFARQRWYRFVYPQAFRSLYAEPDGTLIAGDSSGFVRTLDQATKQDDGSNIAVVMWTPVDDNGEPWNYKDAENIHLRLDTGDATATVNFHLNGNDASSRSETFAQTATDTDVTDISSTAQFTQLQLRVTGSFSTFTFRGYRVNYLDNPTPLVLHDTGFIDLSPDILKWVRRIRVKAKSNVNMTLTPYWDGTAGTARSITATVGKPTVYEVPLGREDKGKVARVVVTGSSPFHVYWVEFVFNGTGKQWQKRFSFNQEIA